MSEKNHRIAKNTVYLYIRMTFSLFVTLYTSRVVLSVIGIEDYGVFNVVAGFVSMFSFLNVALSSSIQRFLNYENGKNGEIGFQKVYITSLFIQLILAVIAFVFVETIGLWYFNNKIVIPDNRFEAAKILFQLSVFSMLVIILQVPFSSVILAKERMNYYAIVGMIDVVLKLVIVFIIKSLSGDKLISYAWLISVVSVVNFLLYFVYTRLCFKRLRFKFCFYKDLFKSMIKFSGWSALGGFSQIMQHQGLNLVLNRFFGPTVNAARGLSYQVKSAMVGFVSNVTIASRPQMVEAFASGDRDRAIRLMVSTSKLCFLLLLLMALPISIEIDYVLNIWLNHTVPQHTASFTILILVGTLIDILQTPIGMLVYATGRIAKFNAYLSVLGLSVLPIAFILLQYGCIPEVVYIVSCFVSLVIQLVCVFILSRLTGYPISDYLRKVIYPLFIVVAFSLIIAIIPHILMSSGIFRFLSVVFLSFFSVCSFGYFIALDKSEKILARRLFFGVLYKIKAIRNC